MIDRFASNESLSRNAPHNLIRKGRKKIALLVDPPPPHIGGRRKFHNPIRFAISMFLLESSSIILDPQYVLQI